MGYFKIKVPTQAPLAKNEIQSKYGHSQYVLQKFASV